MEAMDTDVGALRTFLGQRYGTDFGASDDQMAAVIESSKAQVTEHGWGWMDLAAERLRVRATWAPEGLGPPAAGPA